MNELQVVNYSTHPVSVPSLEVAAEDGIVIFALPTVLNNKPEVWLHFLIKCTYFGLIQNGSTLFAASQSHQNGYEIHKSLHKFLLETKRSCWEPIRITQLYLDHPKSGGAAFNASRGIDNNTLTESTLVHFIRYINEPLTDNLCIPLISEGEPLKPSGFKTMIIKKGRIQHPEDTTPDFIGEFISFTVQLICNTTVGTWVGKKDDKVFKVHGIFDNHGLVIPCEEGNLRRDLREVNLAHYDEVPDASVIAAIKSLHCESSTNNIGGIF